MKLVAEGVLPGALHSRLSYRGGKKKNKFEVNDRQLTGDRYLERRN